MNRIITVGEKQINVFYDEKNEFDRFLNDLIDNEEYSPAFKHKTVVDVGANIGLFSLYAYDYADVIYAIEPLKANFDNLTKTIKENKLDKIKLFHLAISDKTFTAHIEPTTSYGGSHIADTGEEVEAMSLAQFMRMNNIDYIDILKMDTEGHETTIFNSPDFKEISRSIGLIIFEHGGVEESYMNEMGFSLERRKWVEVERLRFTDCLYFCRRI